MRVAFIARDAGRFAGRVIGSGHCVPWVQRASGAPHTSEWRRGVRVRGHRVEGGTAIATFGGDPWRYENRLDGSSHVAILIVEEACGLRVWDAWIGRAVSQRTIGFRNGVGTANNDGDRYHVVLPAGGGSAIRRPTRSTSEVGERLGRGSRGPGVEELQRRLGIAVTGIYGAQTEAAVRGFQRSAGLAETGITGPLTWGAIGEEEG
ncbi:MAG: hypothetical protein C5B60_10580 [Chloroflexi bacterium]|nr:MAG: hypothetical protein C5B60_10580 [Chloroflexota bacterium]